MLGAALTVLGAACPAIGQQSAPPSSAALSTDALPLEARVQALKYLGDLNDDLTFTPVSPCRLADTRVAGGALAPRAGRAFSATSAAMIAAAGGNATGCGVPTGPTGLALTLTAIGPTQQGNLVAYASGAAVPLSSALNFLAGQVIANTTVVPSNGGTGNNFELFNNSDGVTHVAVDVVGYFYAPLAPDCVSITQRTPAAASATFSVTSTCATGFRITMGGCATSVAAAGTDWQTATFNATADGWVCAGRNGATAATITAQAYCCRKPGR